MNLKVRSRIFCLYRHKKSLLRGKAISQNLQKYWLANGLNISDYSDATFQAKEGKALFLLLGATLPFLVYSLLFDLTFQKSPIEHLSYLFLFLYVLFIFTTAFFSKKFRTNIRPWIAYALPFAGFVQYLNMYISGPNAINMMSSIVVIVFGSAIVKRNLEVLVLIVFSLIATAAIIFLKQDHHLHLNYLPYVLACLVFTGMAQYFRNYLGQVQAHRANVLANSLLVWDYVLGNANIVMALLDPRGKIVEINENADIYVKEKVLGRDFASLIVDDERTVFSSAMTNVLETKKALSCKISAEGSKRNLLRLAVTFWPIIEHDDVVGVMAFALDVSAEEKNEQQTQQAAQLSILGEISATIAHEIKNPLTVISGSTEVLIMQIQKLGEGEQFLPRLDKIRQMSERIVTIIKNVRRMYHTGTSEPSQECLLAEIINDAASFCAHKCMESAISIEVIQKDARLSVHGKPLMLSQAVLNLMHNSIDAAATLKEKWIRIEVLDLGANVQISVIDSGRGIPEQVLKNVGQPFYTTKSAGKGNGLGINLARRVIEEHGGVFRYDPDHAHTKFDLILPKNKAA